VPEHEDGGGNDGDDGGEGDVAGSGGERGSDERGGQVLAEAGLGGDQHDAECEGAADQDTGMLVLPPEDGAAPLALAPGRNGRLACLRSARSACWRWGAC
jgi:hypothetical protein